MGDVPIDRRRKERGFMEPGDQSNFMLFQVASVITPASVSVTASTSDNPQLVTISPTTFRANVMRFVSGTAAIRTGKQPGGTGVESVMLNNYDLTLAYTIPTDATRAAFGVAVLIDGVWVVLWVGC